jgi:hypothetical protein
LAASEQADNSNLLQIDRISGAIRSCLLLPTVACWYPTDALIGAQVPASSMFSACYCLDRHCVLKSLVTSESDRGQAIESRFFQSDNSLPEQQNHHFAVQLVRQAVTEIRPRNARRFRHIEDGLLPEADRCGKHRGSQRRKCTTRRQRRLWDLLISDHRGHPVQLVLGCTWLPAHAGLFHPNKSGADHYTTS